MRKELKELKLHVFR